MIGPEIIAIVLAMILILYLVYIILKGNDDFLEIYCLLKKYRELSNSRNKSFIELYEILYTNRNKFHQDILDEMHIFQLKHFPMCYDENGNLKSEEEIDVIIKEMKEKQNEN